MLILDVDIERRLELLGQAILNCDGDSRKLKDSMQPFTNEELRTCRASITMVWDELSAEIGSREASGYPAVGQAMKAIGGSLV